jgi:hypothetical protein
MADRDAHIQSVPGEAPHEPPTQNPEPPNTTTVVMAYPSGGLGPLAPPSDER